MKLSKAWESRLKLYAEGNRLGAKGDKLYAEGNELQAKALKLQAAGLKLYAKGNELRAEGDELWVDTILKEYGDIKSEWKNWNVEYRSYDCHLENGEIYGF